MLVGACVLGRREVGKGGKGTLARPNIHKGSTACMEAGGPDRVESAHAERKAQVQKEGRKENTK